MSIWLDLWTSVSTLAFVLGGGVILAVLFEMCVERRGEK